MAAFATRGMLEPSRHPTQIPRSEVVAPGFPLKLDTTQVGYATPASLVGSGNDANVGGARPRRRGAPGARRDLSAVAGAGRAPPGGPQA